MDKKDEIISMQLDLIRHMTEQNIKRISSDIWGADKASTDAKKSAPDVKSGALADSSKSGAPTKDTENGAPNKTAKDGAAPKAPKNGENEEKLPEREPIEKLLSELDGYIGLARVKDEVRSLINMAKVYKMRRDCELPVSDVSLHMVFSGNPGTGKTMIARFMARVYHSIGLLSKGQLVECDRSGLVAGFVGQTAIKTTDVLKSALGGVLFIDEAYSLTDTDERDFGGEAVDTVLKFMEDNRDDIVVIVAGYTDLMEDFVDSNPGLRSRFNKYLEFDDYTADEMTEIFALNCKKGLYELESDAEELLREYFGKMASSAASFGNARGVRNTFEKVLSSQADRLSGADCITREDLMRITADDVKAFLSKENEK